jgi:hypothetical protein
MAVIARAAARQLRGAMAVRSAAAVHAARLCAPLGAHRRRHVSSDGPARKKGWSTQGQQKTCGSCDQRTRKHVCVDGVRACIPSCARPASAAVPADTLVSRRAEGFRRRRT